MTRFRVAINLAVFVALFGIMVAWLVRNIVSVDQIDRPYRLSAEFPNAFGILPNAEVTYLGVNFGSVSNLDRIPGGVRVDMDIQRGKRIPAGSSANVLRKSAIGEQYVDFAPPPGATTGGRAYEPGTVVPMERTTVPIEFSEMLRSASALVSSIPPESVSTLVHEAAAAVAGRADSLQQLVDAGDRLSASFAARTEMLDRLATNNTRLTHVLTEHRESLGSSISDLRQVADSLRNAKGDTALLLDRGSQLLGQTADLVAHQKGNLDCSLKALDLLTNQLTTPARLAGTRVLFRLGPGAFAGVWDSRDVESGRGAPLDGPWLRVGFISNRNNPPTQFVPPKPVPAVKARPACASALRAATGDYRPSTAGGGPRLPATGGAALAGVGLALVAAALSLRLAGEGFGRGQRRAAR